MKNIVITGANEGIGFHMVRQFLGDGKNVAVLDLGTGQLDPLAAAYPGRLLVERGDVRDADFVRDAVRWAEEKFGSVDVAIHNACFCPFASFEALSDAEHRRAFEVNYFGAVHLCRAALPVMRAQGRGEVFFTSSGVGVTGFPGIGAYAASKGALESLAKCLALEYGGDGVGFHLLHPPLTRTRSAAPLPVPDAMKADAETVGRGLARRIGRRSFVVCHSRGQALQTRLMYLFPMAMGRFLERGLKKLAQEKPAE